MNTGPLPDLTGTVTEVESFTDSTGEINSTTVVVLDDDQAVDLAGTGALTTAAGQRMLVHSWGRGARQSMALTPGDRVRTGARTRGFCLRDGDRYLLSGPSAAHPTVLNPAPAPTV